MRKLLSIVTLAAATAFGLVGTAGIASADETGAEPTTSSGIVSSSINLGTTQIADPGVVDLTSAGTVDIKNPVGTANVNSAPSTADDTPPPRGGGASMPDTMFMHGDLWGNYYW
jgi:hypothetical protein